MTRYDGGDGKQNEVNAYEASFAKELKVDYANKTK